ncbi:uncharacterized protein [Gossypium hirsutum]|uniref:NB-ARC domain-containing protein n=1 Tax=Gossypium hirsutum TaxID=3635 RepID=A0ABM3BZF9_GOSHI|nr:uncharacterized protein LOC121231078 [Gossypium hirsutum]
MTYFLGMEVHQSDRGIFISQHSFALKILDKFCMHNCKAVSTPVAQGEKLTSSGDQQRVDERHYRSLVGCLLYLTVTRPDIMFGVSLLSRFMHCCNEAHLKAAKRILRYIKGTASFGVMFESQNQLKLEGYSDSDWAGSLDDMKTEAEYIAAAGAVNQAIWLRKLLYDLNETQDEATEIWVDNQSAVAIAKNPVFHGKTKHFKIKLHFVREAEQAKEFNFSLFVMLVKLKLVTRSFDVMADCLANTVLQLCFNVCCCHCSNKNELVGISGIYGLGGVGKTTLLNQINNKFHDTTHDYLVIWAVASQDRPIEKVQDEIAKRIGLSNERWKSKSLDEKAGDICSRLYNRRFALLLDDIWEWFDLTRAGIPIPTLDNDCKVIFTTRRLDVCCQMQPNMDNNIRVACLPSGEAFKLFEEKVGSETLQMHPDIHNIAEAVVEECAGLPLALITIGRAMASKKTSREWEYAIEVLRQSAASVFPGVGKEMYLKLKFSYDCLPDERLRSCFLYCSLYPEDHLIEKDELVDC